MAGNAVQAQGVIPWELLSGEMVEGTQFGQGVISWELLREGKNEERSPTTGHAVGYGAGENRAATVSVRPVVADQTGGCQEPAPPPLIFSSYAAVDDEDGRTALPKAEACKGEGNHAKLRYRSARLIPDG